MTQRNDAQYARSVRRSARRCRTRRQRDRAEDEHLTDDQRRESLHVRRSRPPGDGRLHCRPEVTDLRGRELRLPEKPPGRGHPDLVAALEPDPAVVLHGQREDERQGDLRADQRPADRARVREQPIHGAPQPVGDADGASGDRHPRSPSDTRRRSARSRRAAAYAPRSRRAREPGCRRRSAWAGRSASRCPT